MNSPSYPGPAKWKSRASSSMITVPTSPPIPVGRLGCASASLRFSSFGENTTPHLPFTTAGATAYQRDVPSAEIHLLEAGHFALDEACDEVAALTRSFLESHSLDRPSPTRRQLRRPAVARRF